MGEVIRWEKFERKSEARPQAVGHSADIVIFHGVRIERLTDEMMQASLVRNRRFAKMPDQLALEDLISA
jgi:hypothetical protein